MFCNLLNVCRPSPHPEGSWMTRKTTPTKRKVAGAVYSCSTQNYYVCHRRLYRLISVRRLSISYTCVYIYSIIYQTDKWRKRPIGNVYYRLLLFIRRLLYPCYVTTFLEPIKLFGTINIFH